MAPSLMMTISKVPAPISSRAMNLTVIHGPAGVLHYFLGKKVELVVPPPPLYQLRYGYQYPVQKCFDQSFCVLPAMPTRRMA